MSAERGVADVAVALEGARAILSGDPCVAVPLGRALARRAGARA